MKMHGFELSLLLLIACAAAAHGITLLVPLKVVGSLMSKSPPNGACANCTLDARVNLDRYTYFTYFDYYSQMPSVTNPYERAGKRTCRDFRSSMRCYEGCLAQDPAAKNSEEYLSLHRATTRFCEGAYRPGAKSCRLADIRGCDKRFRKIMCGDQLKGYNDCVEKTLSDAGQDCSGACSPASRFYQSNLFSWDMECSLKKSAEFRCSTIVSSVCFSTVKDSDYSYGYYDEINQNSTLSSNLDGWCRSMRVPLPCMETATNGFTILFGINVTNACGSISSDMAQISSTWQSLISPLCNNQTTGKSLDEVCGAEPAATMPPEEPQECWELEDLARERGEVASSNICQTVNAAGSATQTGTSSGPPMIQTSHRPTATQTPATATTITAAATTTNATTISTTTSYSTSTVTFHRDSSVGSTSGAQPSQADRALSSQSVSQLSTQTPTEVNTMAQTQPDPADQHTEGIFSAIATNSVSVPANLSAPSPTAGTTNDHGAKNSTDTKRAKDGSQIRKPDRSAAATHTSTLAVLCPIFLHISSWLFGRPHF